MAASESCGDGTIDYLEECDDANRTSGDGCNDFCYLESGFCGDGVLQRALGEQCEPGLHNPELPYGCDSSCHFLSEFCGNDVLDPGEQCDEGEGNADLPGAVCRSNCSLSICGDGILDPDEICDDGNFLNGDACNTQCGRKNAADEVIVIRFPFTDEGIDLSLPVSVVGPDGTARPLASIQYDHTRAPVGDTGPAAIIFMASGAAAGVGYVRKRARGKK